MDVGFWHGYLKQLLSAECMYTGSPHAIFTYQAIPPAHATVLLVFVQADVPHEDPNSYLVRTRLNNFTLNRFREQFGDAIEITVVEMYTLRYSRHHYPVANTIISNFSDVGQDWGMYQQGIMASFHRLDQYRVIIVMNEQMVGPFVNFKPMLKQALSKHDMYVASHWAGCCIRGFFIAFGHRSIQSEQFRRYWTRVRFPCGKLGPMVLGEGLLGHGPVKPATQSCVTSTNTAIGKGMLLAQQKVLGAPFLYRWGIETEYNKQWHLIEIFLRDYSVPPKLEDCIW